MSQMSRGIFGAVAIALTLGAVPLAAGRDVPGSLRDRLQDRLQNPLGTPVTGINRAAKADRAAGVVRSDASMRTISLQLNGLSDTSVLVRVPVAQAARSGASAPSWTKYGDGKRTVACEPVVSVLTEVAKLLQPGRCVT